MAAMSYKMQANRQMKKLLPIILSTSFPLVSSPAFACFEETIVKPQPFMGNDGEIFQLSDGSIWEIKYEYEYLYEYYPDVIICPGQNMLIIDSKKLNVEKIAGGYSSQVGGQVIESQIEGTFNGWGGETIVKLTNGQIWEQAEYHYEYHYAYRPDVLIYKTGSRYKMQVEGADAPIHVKRLK